MSDTASSFRILIAEDNELSRTVMAQILKNKGHDAVGARDGQKALSLLAQGQFDMVIIDINMEPMGGFDFTRTVRLSGNTIPVIAITGTDPTDLEMRASELGIATILQKPVLPERLVHIVERTCALARDPANTTLNQPSHDPKDMMLRAIELAVKTASRGKGRAFGAVIADKSGQIIAEGTNEAVDPLNPLDCVEAIAIRKAAKHLNRGDLSDCILYCSFQPTKLGRAMIEQVRIGQVFYALSAQDIAAPDAAPHTQPSFSAPDYQQICLEEARRAFSISS